MANIFITGCSSGIGYESAHYLMRKGHHVLASARKDEDVRTLQQEGLQAIKLDVTDEEAIKRTIPRIQQMLEGRIDVLFNNAGFGQPGALEDIPTQALKAQFETNVIGLHQLTRAIIPIMRQQGQGKIIQHSSVLGFVSLKFRGAYNASKYAVEALCDTYRLELKGSGIQMISLHTGPITSKFRENAMPHFHHYIDTNHSHYKQQYENELLKRKTSKDTDAFTRSPAAVYTVVEKIILSKNPKAYYNITLATKLLFWLKKLLPTAVLDNLLLKI